MTFSLDITPLKHQDNPTCLTQAYCPLQGKVVQVKNVNGKILYCSLKYKCNIAKINDMIKSSTRHGWYWIKQAQKCLIQKEAKKYV